MDEIDDPNKQDESDNTAIIVGSVVGGVVLVAITVAIIVRSHKRRLNGISPRLKSCRNSSQH